MKLSIIIPVYNAEKYLEECLGSILPEMDDAIELLLIDDGSKDTSYEIMQKYSCKNVRAFHHENHGVSYTRNRGIMAAKGDYVMFADADDRLLNGWKDCVLRYCNGQADVIYFGKGIADFKGSIKKADIIYSIFGIANGLGNMSSPCSKLYRREFLLNNQILFHEGLINGEDGIMNLETVLKSEGFECCGESVYQYRIYTGSSSRRYNTKFFDSNLTYFSLAEALLREGAVKESSIVRCMTYAVVYSIYLYLFLISNVPGRKEQKMALKRLKEPKIQQYIKQYPGCADCTKVVQLIYWLVNHNASGTALWIVTLRNTVRKLQKQEIKWVAI